MYTILIIMIIIIITMIIIIITITIIIIVVIGCTWRSTAPTETSTSPALPWGGRFLWVFIKEGCSRRGVQWMGVALYNKKDL